MRRRDVTLEHVRPIAGLLLLGVFLLAAQFAPVAHLATHRNDHTHGPEPGAVGHDHDDGRDHNHHHDHDSGGDHDDTAADVDHNGDHDPVPSDPPSSNEHGRASVAHFDLALLDGPPLPFLPPPAETEALAADVVVRGHDHPSQPQPPARGPPRLS